MFTCTCTSKNNCSKNETDMSKRLQAFLDMHTVGHKAHDIKHMDKTCISGQTEACLLSFMVWVNPAWFTR